MKIFLILRIIIIILLMIVGSGAIYGGWMLIQDPSGESMTFPVELLEGTPFKNYFIPGVILIVSVGLMSIFVAILTMIGAKKYPVSLIFQGGVLIGWLSIELLLNSAFFHPVYHYPLFAIGIMLIVLGVLFRKKSKIETEPSTV